MDFQSLRLLGIGEGFKIRFENQNVVPTRLAALLGYKIKRLRITDEVPPRISVIDLATAITQKDAKHAAQDVAYVKERHPEVIRIMGDFKFNGQGQKKTPVADLRSAVELTGRHAARVLRSAKRNCVCPEAGHMSKI